MKQFIKLIRLWKGRLGRVLQFLQCLAMSTGIVGVSVGITLLIYAAATTFPPVSVLIGVMAILVGIMTVAMYYGCW